MTNRAKKRPKEKRRYKLPYGLVNIEMLQRIKRCILQKPRCFTMAAWFIDYMCGLRPLPRLLKDQD